jgi:hypothetical protein
MKRTVGVLADASKAYLTSRVIDRRAIDVEATGSSAWPFAALRVFVH